MILSFLPRVKAQKPASCRYYSKPRMAKVIYASCRVRFSSVRSVGLRRSTLLNIVCRYGAPYSLTVGLTQNSLWGVHCL